MRVDQLMKWFTTKRKGRQHYATIYWPRPDVVQSIVHVAHPAQSLPTVVSHSVTAVTLDFVGAIVLNTAAPSDVKATTVEDS